MVSQSQFNDIRVAVTSPSFSRNLQLREALLGHFSAVSFHEGERLEGDRLIAFLADHDAAIVGLEVISRNLVKWLPNLRLVAKYGVGLDNVDQSALADHGIALGWTPGVNAQSVAELTLCFMLALMRNVFCCGMRLKSGEWRKEGGQQLYGKTVGIIGCGHVGKAVVCFLAPFRCRVLVHDIVKYREFYRQHGIEAVSFDEAIRQSDIVSLHVPLDASTRHMISEPILKRMRPGAFLVNTSRGGVVDTGALKRALVEKWIEGAALDVFEEEPCTDAEFLGLSNLVVSPHIGGNAHEAIMAMGKSAIGHVVNFFTREAEQHKDKEPGA